jgi:hypothetical protein
MQERTSGKALKGLIIDFYDAKGKCVFHIVRHEKQFLTFVANSNGTDCLNFWKEFIIKDIQFNETELTNQAGPS